MFFKVVRQRRSCRSFLDKKIEQNKIDLIKEAALRSPSSRSLNPWDFIFITKKDVLNNLSKAKPHGANFLKTAPLAVVVAADPEKCDVWIEDTSIASIYIQLAAEALGLKSCWCQIRKRENSPNVPAQNFVKTELNIPQNLEILSIIAIGYPETEAKGHPMSYVENQQNKIHMNRF